MLEVSNLKFGGGGCPVHTLSFSVKRGDILTINGPSGIGKTTLLNILAGYEHAEPSSKARWDGIDLLDLAVWQRPLSFLFQDGNLFDHLPCRKTIELALSPTGQVSRSEQRLIDTTLKRLGVDGLSNRFPGELSGGEAQRMGLARALVRKSPLLLLDEPFSALDLKARTGAIELICQLASEEQLAVLVVSHDQGDARRLRASSLSLRD
jgi:thiamine transport system ATP-binding protein